MDVHMSSSATRARVSAPTAQTRSPVSPGDLEAILRARLSRASSERPQAKAEEPAEGSGDVILESLEARISAAELTPQQKDMARRMVAMSVKTLDDPKQMPKVVGAIHALIAAWEEANRGKKLEQEDPSEVKRITDYLADYAEAEQAASEAAQAGLESQSAAKRPGSSTPGSQHSPEPGPTVGARLDVVV
jgi:hypothetical protein